VTQGNIREKLIGVTLEWEQKFGVAPAITTALSEYDAARIVGCPIEEYCIGRANRTAVSKGHDFEFNGKKYQVKANRPSGKPGSPVTLVSKASNYDWDYLVWILYDQKYNVQEAWLWEVDDYKDKFDRQSRLSPEDMRRGNKLNHVLSAVAG
jgi:hypothetical protein